MRRLPPESLTADYKCFDDFMQSGNPYLMDRETVRGFLFQCVTLSELYAPGLLDEIQQEENTVDEGRASAPD